MPAASAMGHGRTGDDNRLAGESRQAAFSDRCASATVDIHATAAGDRLPELADHNGGGWLEQRLDREWARQPMFVA